MQVSSINKLSPTPFSSFSIPLHHEFPASFHSFISLTFCLF